MATEHASLEGFIGDFIRRQPMFFVATAAADGLVNVSPKGGTGTLVVLDERRVAYVDLTGSGSETIAHVRALNRITLMWCAFDGPPMIARIHGSAEVITRDSEQWPSMIGLFPDLPGARAIVVVTAERISDSCGMSVPEMSFERDREQLNRWARGKGEEGLRDYWERKNATSLDGLPALAPHERV